jgi:TolB-like protein/Tfp pilus assembly protein PilF/class 3 adenylate cyclase
MNAWQEKDMPNEQELKAEIGHVLFIDIVGYSKLLINEQSELLRTLKQIVRETAAVRVAKEQRDLIRLPTGDGMALVFRNDLEAPADCALQLGAALRQHPELRLRMGIHSGPIREMLDVNERANMTGAGIDVAQRVMDCSDAGHILLSKRAADDLAPYPRWNAQLHDLGEYEVKHGARIHLFNLYTDEAGNPAMPSKCQAGAGRPIAASGSRVAWHIPALLALVLLSLGGAGWWFATRVTHPKPEPRPAQSAPAILAKSIAVLPFENLSSDKENAYFTDGVQDEILTDLAKIADLKVISRTSVMLYKSGNPRNLREIGEQLGVAHVVEGSVQRAGNKVRVTAQLVDARTDAHLWAEHYDRPLDDVFAIQSEIARAIADQLQAKLSPSEQTAIEERPTADLEAHDLYLRAIPLTDAAAMSRTRKDDLLQAVDLLNQAIARDPAFLLAYCRLANVHDNLYLLGLDHTPGRLALAEAAANAALRLRPDSGDAHLALARHLYSNLDYDRARTEIDIARRTLPNDPRIYELSAYIDRRQSRWSEAAHNFERALELDPRNAFTLNQLAVSYEVLRAYPEAIAALDRSLALRPNDPDFQLERALADLQGRADTRPLHNTIATLLAKDPASAKKLAAIRHLLALCERDAVAAEAAHDALGEGTYGPNAIQFSRTFGEGMVARMKGDDVAARAAFTQARVSQEEILRVQPDYAPALCVLGLIDAGLGRKEDALREGRRAIELLPVTKDSVNCPALLQFFAVICAWTGEKDLAIEQLSRAIQYPGPLTYGSLRLHPFWDPLRGDPRFEKIVASLAPKQSK